MSGGTATESSLLYGFFILPQGGYDTNGNIISATDSVMGQWNYSYDNLNRLLGGSAINTSSQGISNYYAGVLARLRV